MASFKILSDEELKLLELEFKQFLIANGIHDKEWKLINEKEPDKAIDLVEQFSDLVYEKSLENVKYIAYFTATEIKAFWYRKDKALLVGLKDTSGKLDFRRADWWMQLPEQIENVEVYQLEKEVDTKLRGIELFKLISGGAMVISEDYFKRLYQLVEQK